jgi:hypothetical protein
MRLHKKTQFTKSNLEDTQYIHDTNLNWKTNGGRMKLSKPEEARYVNFDVAYNVEHEFV